MILGRPKCWRRQLPCNGYDTSMSHTMHFNRVWLIVDQEKLPFSATISTFVPKNIYGTSNLAIIEDTIKS